LTFQITESETEDKELDVLLQKKKTVQPNDDTIINAISVIITPSGKRKENNAIMPLHKQTS